MNCHPTRFIRSFIFEHKRESAHTLLFFEYMRANARAFTTLANKTLNRTHLCRNLWNLFLLRTFI